MNTLISLWMISAALTVGLYVALSLFFDGRVAWSTWVRLALGLMSLLGPVGTVIAVVFLFRLAVAVTREVRKTRGIASGMFRARFWLPVFGK